MIVKRASRAVRVKASSRDRDRPRRRSISDIFFKHCIMGPLASRTHHQDANGRKSTTAIFHWGLFQ